MRYKRASLMSPISARSLLVTAFLVLAPFFKAGAQTPLPTADAHPGPDYRHGLEQETFFLVNQYRKAGKLPPLQWSDTITQVARAHSKDMAAGDVDFGHDGFSRRVKQLQAVMRGLLNAGENVLKTDDPDEVAQRAVALWLKSPHHLENIRGDYTNSGMGIWVDNKGMIYFTQIFINLQPPVEQAQAAPPPPLVTPFGMLATPKTRTGP